MLDEIIQDFMQQRTLDENLRFFEEAEVTVGPVLAMDDLLDHPYMEGRQVVTEFDDPDVETIPAHTPVPRLSHTPGRLNTPAPALGAHTKEIEGELQDRRLIRLGARRLILWPGWLAGLGGRLSALHIGHWSRTCSLRLGASICSARCLNSLPTSGSPQKEKQ